MTASEKLHQREQNCHSLLCVGLDSDMRKIPSQFLSSPTPQFAFNQWIIDQTHEFVSSFKPNLAFYEARGDQGLKELKLTMEYLQENHPDIFTIADAKRADIGSTNEGYVKSIFDWFGFDAITLHPYLGKEALHPFLERDDKVSIILCHTSNPGAGEFQDMLIQSPSTTGQKYVWEYVAEQVSTHWNSHRNCMLVMGATYPEQIQRVRKIVGDLPLLIPGIGAQGGDLQATINAAQTSQGSGMIINNSRGIIFSRTPSTEARALRDSINGYRNTP